MNTNVILYATLILELGHLKDHEMVIKGYGIYQNIVLTFILRFSLEFTST